MKNNSHIILVVEDDNVSCELFREIFSKANIDNYIIVTEGEEAIEICKNNRAIGLVLMDIKLPGINGHIAMREIKQIRGTLPVVAQTACVSKDAKDIYMDSGFDDCLFKPIDSRELIKLIEKYLHPVLN